MQDLNAIPVTTEEDEAFKAMGVALAEKELAYQKAQQELLDSAPHPDYKPSMFWNHRIVDLSKDNQGEPWFEVQEVYYNSDGQPCGYCNPCLGGESIDEIQIQIRRFTECLAHPILNAETDFNNKFHGEDDGKEQD
jgi:hypothetical protein